jgi:hypothetical protein
VITASAETKWLMVDPAAATFESEFSSVTTSYAEPVTSEIGTKRTSGNVRPMSAIGGGAYISPQGRDFRF